MRPLDQLLRTRTVAVELALAVALTPCVHTVGAQMLAGSGGSGPTSPEPLLGVAMGTNRRALNEYLVARGWTRVADSVAGVGSPSVHAGTFAGRPAEIIAMFGDSSGRLLTLAINVPARSTEELRAAYADLYRMIERRRCAAKIPHDYAAQLDSILRGPAPQLSNGGGTFKPVLLGHTTLTLEENTDWPRPTWASAAASIGTRLTASRLHKESRWPYEATVWSSVLLMLENPTMCADSRATLDSAMRADRQQRVASSRSKGANDAPLDSVMVGAGPGVTLRVDTLVVRGADNESDGVVKILRRPLGSTVRYEARLEAGYDGLKVLVEDTLAAATGNIVLNGTSVIIAVAQPKARPETRRLYELMRAELTSKNPLAAFVAVECEMDRLQKVYPATAERWIAEVEARAHDPEKDGRAMRRFDEAMSGHEFGGCEDDRRRYPATR